QSVIVFPGLWISFFVCFGLAIAARRIKGMRILHWNIPPLLFLAYIAIAWYCEKHAVEARGWKFAVPGLLLLHSSVALWLIGIATSYQRVFCRLICLASIATYLIVWGSIFYSTSERALLMITSIPLFMIICFPIPGFLWS